jgi:2-amino-4-hydroxy-6-hydroxymethyldihydropteridine diphosphokinase
MPTTTTTTTRTDEGQLFAFSLGSNRGEPRAMIEAAIRRLIAELGPLRVASLYRTEPVSELAQDPFLNTVVLGRGTWSPARLLAVGQAVERGLGRSAGPRDGPREIDVDLLFVGDLTVAEPGLEIPHPRLRQRRFVLAPLAEIAPDLEIPPDGATAAELLESLGDPHWVERLGSRDGS